MMTGVCDNLPDFEWIELDKLENNGHFYYNNTIYRKIENELVADDTGLIKCVVCYQKDDYNNEIHYIVYYFRKKMYVIKAKKTITRRGVKYEIIKVKQ